MKMPNQRAVWNRNANPTAGIAARLNNVVGTLSQGRQMLAELKLILDKYGADFATMGTDLGCSVADATTVYNLVVQASGELNATFSTAVAVAAPGGTRQLVDTLA
jgi:phage-related protein